MSDNLTKEQQEAITDPAAQSPTLQEEIVIENLTEVPIQKTEEILVESENDDSTTKTEEQDNNTSKEKQKDKVEEPENKQEAQEASNTLNPLDSFLENINEPKTEEEFYKASFDNFKKIHDYYLSLKSNVLSETALQEIQAMASEYTEALYGFHEYCQDEQAKKELQNVINIWDLAVKLYISSEINKQHNTCSIVEWLNLYDPIEPNENIQDWNALYRHILRANMDDAIHILSSFKLDQNESKFVKPLCDMLMEYKDVNNIENWKSKCMNRLESIQNTSETECRANFIHIYFLLMGSSDAITRSGTFFDQLVGVLQFDVLHASRREISVLAENLDTTQLKDQTAYICAALLLGRIDDALGNCHVLWLQAHLGHLLLVLGIRDELNTMVNGAIDVEVIVDPIYQMVNVYAQFIAEKYNMWNEAVIYISICIPNRVLWIKILLNHEKAQDISLLQSVLETVDLYSINQVMPYIHKSMGQLYEKVDDVYNATIEYGNAQDTESLDRIGTDLFIKCLETGKLQNNVVGFEDVISSPIYDCITSYNHLRNSLESAQYKEASRIVLDIFTTHNLPDRFKPIIFIDADAILSTKESYYNQTELVKLLDIFQSLLDALSNQTYFEQYYQHALGTKYTSDTIIAMLREKMSYRAITACITNE